MVEKLLQEDAIYHKLLMNIINGDSKEKQFKLFFDNNNIVYKSSLIIKTYIEKYENSSEITLLENLKKWNKSFDDIYCIDENEAPEIECENSYSLILNNLILK